MSPSLRLPGLLSLAVLTAAPLSAQAPAPSPDRWQLTLQDGQYIWNVRLVKVVGDTLIVTSRDSLIATPLVRITEIRLLPETVLRVGDGHRSAIGALGDNNAPVFDLTSLAPADRRMTVQRILDYEASVQ